MIFELVEVVVDFRQATGFCPVQDTLSTQTVSVVWMTTRGSFHTVAAQSPAGVTEVSRRIQSSFFSSLRLPAQPRITPREPRSLTLTICSPSAKLIRWVKSSFTLLLMDNLAIQQNSRM